MLVALVVVGAMSIVAGSLTAVFAGRFPGRQLPGRQQKIEEVGSGVFALGLVLVAASFPAL